VKASAVEPAHAQRFRSWVQSNPYEALSCQETNDPCERFFFRFTGPGAVGIWSRGLT
jgi:hypothetical protein